MRRTDLTIFMMLILACLAGILAAVLAGQSDEVVAFLQTFIAEGQP